MKKILFLFSVILVIVSLSACTGNQSGGDDVYDVEYTNTAALNQYGDTDNIAKTQMIASVTENIPKAESKDDGIRPDFKASMDAYEKFMNEYVAFMKKYAVNPSDFGLLADYAEYISKYADFTNEFDKWDDSEMNSAELKYYLEVQTRVSKKMLEIAQ